MNNAPLRPRHIYGSALLLFVLLSTLAVLLSGFWDPWPWMASHAWIASWYSAVLFTATEITLIVILVTVLLPILGPLDARERRAMGLQLKDHAKREAELQED